MIRKLKSKRGISKEATYDILGTFLTILLVVTILFSMSKKTIDSGDTVLGEQDKLLDVLNK